MHGGYGKQYLFEMPVFSFVTVGVCEKEREHTRKRMDRRRDRCEDKGTALQLYMLPYLHLVNCNTEFGRER